MKIGAVNNIKDDLYREIENISSDRFDFIDMALEPGFSSKYDPMEVRRILDDTGLGIIGHTSAFLPAVFPLDEVNKKK